MPASHTQSLTFGSNPNPAKRQKQTNRVFILLLIFGILLVMLSTTRQGRNYFALWHSLASSAAASANGTITGTVFRDYNADGVQGAYDLGVLGIEVRAYNTSGANVTPGGVVTTDASGDYSIATTDAGTGPYRVEFTIPAALANLKPGQFGTGSKTTVQFVASTPASSVNLGVNDPADYCQMNPQLAVPCYVLGDVTSSTVGAQPAVVEFAYNSGSLGRKFDESELTCVVVPPEVYPLLTSAPPSPLGTGNAKPPVPVPAPPSQPSSCSALSPSNPLSPRSRIINTSLGEVGAVNGVAYHRQTNNLLVAAYMKRFVSFPGPSHPNDHGVGTIYVIDRKTNPNVVSEFYFAPSGSDTHDYGSGSSLGAPFGDTTARDDVGFKGWADIDVTPEGNLLYGVNLFDSSIHMVPISTSGGSITAGAATQISFPSNPCSKNEWRPGGLKIRDGKVYATVTCTAQSSQASDLHLFVYSFPVGQTNPSFTQVADTPLNYVRTGTWAPWNSTNHDQPWGRDIEFDEAGNMYVGLANRFADMSNGNTTSLFVVTAGDTIHAIPTGVGTFTFSGLSPEFIDDDTGHQENDHGTLALVLGTGELVAPALIGNLIDGVRHYNSAVGHNGLEPSPGKPVSYFGLLQTDRNAITAGDPFGKTNGLGDIEALCNPAPIELGNRIWKDGNCNGIQDPNEAGISNVTVLLFKNGLQVGTSTTNANGEYLFNASNVSGGLVPNMAYEIHIAKAQATLSGLMLTKTDADSSLNGDARDSDAAMVGNDAVISLTTGEAGANNHTLDAGFCAEPIKCDTICFRSPQYWLLNLNHLPQGTVLIAGVNGNQSVSTSNVNAIKLALKGNALGFGTLSPQQQFNQEFVTAQLNLLAAGGGGSPVSYNVMWANLSCYGIKFNPVTLSNGVTLTVDSMVKELWMQTAFAAHGNNQTDFTRLAGIFDLLNGNNLGIGCN